MFTDLKTKAAHLLRGNQAEEQAYQFLLKQGLQPICRNYRSKYGELDLVMQEGETVAIIEVRFRQSDRYGSALESITTRKQARIIAAAQTWLAQYPTPRSVRFDVVAISGNGNINWIRNAFQT